MLNAPISDSLQSIYEPREHAKAQTGHKTFQDVQPGSAAVECPNHHNGLKSWTMMHQSLKCHIAPKYVESSSPCLAICMLSALLHLLVLRFSRSKDVRPIKSLGALNNYVDVEVVV